MSNQISHFNQSGLITLSPDDLKLIDSFLENLEKQNKSHETIKSYREDLKRFALWISSEKGVKLKKISSHDISEYIQFIHQGGLIYRPRKNKLIHFFKNFIKKPQKVFAFELKALSTSSQKRHLSTLKNFFQYLKEVREETHKDFLINPVKSKIHHIKLKDKDVTPTKILSREDFLVLEEKIYRTKERLILYLLYYGGFRLSEITFLTFLDFNEESEAVSFMRKGGDIHHLKLRFAKKIFQQLNFYRNLYFSEPHHKPPYYLFTNAKGEKLTEKAMYNCIKKMLSRANLDPDLSPHSFRKACATEYYLESKNLLLVRDYLNHKDAKVTQTYIDKLTLHRYSLAILNLE